jgi:hypothetical protein
LPNFGVTSIGEMWTISSEGVTPPSSLLRAHVPLPLGSPLLQHLASFEESLQVVHSPCCPRELPDAISESLSLDAGSPSPAVPPCALTCFFHGVIGLPHVTNGSAPASARKRHEPITAVGSWAWQFGHRRRHAMIVVAARDSRRLAWAGTDAGGRAAASRRQCCLGTLPRERLSKPKVTAHVAGWRWYARTRSAPARR